MATTLSLRAPARAASASRSGDVPDGWRIAFCGATLLLVWVHLTPFHDLTAVDNIEPSEAGALATQLSFSCLGVATAILLVRLGLDRLRALATLPLLGAAAWVLVSVAASVSPGLSLRRVILLAIASVAPAAILLAARSQRQFANVLAGTALAVLAVCFVSIVIVPDLATHTALDLREPEHAGAWRGVFPHKNEAGAVAVVFLFIGLLTARVGERLLGIALVVASLVFLAGSLSKTALALLPLVLLCTALTGWLRGPGARIALLLGPIALLLLVTLGSIALPPVKTALGAVLPDVTFTGRTDLWEFTWDNILKRPLTGWGYGAFWKTEATLYGGAEQITWVTSADQAHNGYLDVALFMGLPGLALTALAFGWSPCRDLIRSAGRRAPSPLELFFLRLWLYGLATGAFESVFYVGNNAVSFMFTLGVFGLRFLAANGPARP